MNQQPIRLLALDFDGTLADTSGIIITTMQATLQQMHLPMVTAEQVKGVIGLPLKDCFTHLTPMDEATAQACTDIYRDLFKQKNLENPPQPFPNVDATLRQLNEEGITLAIASSRFTRSLQEFIDHFQWNELFSDIIGADKVKQAKPQPEPVNRILSDLHFTPEETLVVGDAPYDILMGKNAGARTCAVTYGNATRQSLKEANPDYIIDDFKQLGTILS
ncbi:MAG: HAD family hydrolase [Prevotella sp.]|jgi:HAD superfamily hydrolase (TIGR01509 family)